MCCTRLAANTGRKKSPSRHHHTTLSGHIFAIKECIDNRKKNSVASWHRYCTASTCSSGRQLNFAALNRGHHLCSAGRPPRWALTHILVICFSKWRPSAILDLFCAHLDHPQRAFDSVYHCIKFGLNRCSSFDNMKVLIFIAFGLKMPIHVPTRDFRGIRPRTWAALPTPSLEGTSRGRSTSYG